MTRKGLEDYHKQAVKSFASKRDACTTKAFQEAMSSVYTKDETYSKREISAMIERTVNESTKDQGEKIDAISHTFEGATETSNGHRGLVPESTYADREKVLRGDGTWGEVNSTSIKLKGYKKPVDGGPIQATDSLNQAIGKLELDKDSIKSTVAALEEKTNSNLDKAIADLQKEIQTKQPKGSYLSTAGTAVNSSRLGGTDASAYAKLDSPAFRGKPTAPTPENGDNTTQIATTAFVMGAISALINSAPESLNTLQELASAMGNDPNFSNTVLKMIGERLPLTGGTIKGNLVVEGKISSKNSIDSTADNATLATKASQLATARTIDGVDFNGTSAIHHFGVCSTAAATQEKAVACVGYRLTTGSRIEVKFTVTNSAANPTLNINKTGAKPVFYRGAAISAGYLAANRTYAFIYNGTQYDLVGDLDTNTNTAMTQNVSTANATYPILLTPTADATANQGAKTGIFASGVKVNPSTKEVVAAKFTGTLNGKAAITGTSTSWIKGRDGASLKQSAYTADTYLPMISMKTEEGSWEVGPYTGNTLNFVYASDGNYKANTNKVSTISFNADRSVTAAKFNGALNGNAATATKATQDKNGNDIAATYLPLAGGAVTGTLTLTKSTDAAAAKDNKPALIIGGASTAAHLELDGNEIMAKADGTSAGDLYINGDGGLVHIGAGGLTVVGTITGNVKGNVTGSSGSCTGNAATATKAANADKVNGLTVLTAVPANAKFTDTTYSNMTAATAKAAGKAGLVPAAPAGAQTKFLRGDGTWEVPTNTTYANFVKSGTGAKAGLVPSPGTTAGTTKYLREDGTWQVPPDHNTTYAAATVAPKANGTAAVGTSAKYAREDHVHPLQTSVSGSSGSCTGNAATATKINGKTIAYVESFNATTKELRLRSLK